MFSRFRRTKSEKPVAPEDVTSNLRGMPALKQRRSERREETLHSLMSGLTGIEPIQNNNTDSHAVEDEPIFGEINIPRNYKRPQSPDSVEYRESRRTNYVDRVVNGYGSHFVFEEEKLNGIEETVFVENDEEEQTSLNSSWRMSKGDSGYKSKDEAQKESNNNNKKKSKKSRKKSSENEEQSRASGLYTVKQQRKESRESSHSMRALTPKERESILCLEEVLKDHPLEVGGTDEVFGVEAPDENEEKLQLSFERSKIDDNEETVDFGYSSVNDISRKYSIESQESVGSIIDLVGNLSSAPTSPIYAVVDKSKKSRDVTDSNDVTASHKNNAAEEKGEKNEASKPINESNDDYGTFAHDVIMQLDEVIQSFSIQTTDDEVTPAERSDSQKEKKLVKKAKRHSSRGSTTDGEKEKKKQEKRRTRDPEKEKERREKRKKKKEREESLKRREERFAKHVDEISALTQDMIKTAQQEQYHEEPIYAQVNKPKKQTALELGVEGYNAADSFIEPPSAFGNDKGQEYTSRIEEVSFENRKPYNTNIANQPKSQQAMAPTTSNSIRSPIYNSNFKYNNDLEEKPNRNSWAQPENKQAFIHTPNKQTINHAFTSTPITSPDGSRTSNHFHQQPLSTATKKPTGFGLRRPASDASDYHIKFQPYMSKYLRNHVPSDRPCVSPTMLEDSSSGLRHVDARHTKGKVLHIEPDKNLVKETSLPVEPLTNSSPVISHVEPPKLRPKSSVEITKAYNNKMHGTTHVPPTTYNHRPVGRPISLNLDESGNLATLTEQRHKSSVIKPYSSFRQDPKPVEKQNAKSRPFVITSMKKPIQLY